MPLYEYRCEACGAKEEKLQGFSAPTAHDCPKCGVAGAMHREISRTAFVLSGSGWYAGGYAGNGKGPSEGLKAPSEPGGAAAKAGDAAEAKPDAGADSGSKGACASGCACHSPKIQALTEPS